MWQTARSSNWIARVQPYELLIGLRYSRAKRRNHFVSFISLISIIGMALGITVLISVMSVMNGFQKEIRERILGVVSHVQVSGVNGKLNDWHKVAAEAGKNPQVIASAPYVAEQGLLSFEQAVKGTIVRGILPEYENQVVDLGRRMKTGRLDALRPGGFGIVLGVDLARTLGATVGDKVLLIAPQGQVTPAGILPRLKQFTVVGIFEVGHYEYDAGLALIHLEDAQKLYRFDGNVSGVRLRLKDLYEAPRVANELAHTLTVDAYINDWTRINANFYRAVQIEKRMMFFVVILIVAVAAFNIVSTLVMAVTDKQSEIAILRTLGASPRSIMKIFIVQGTLIGILGTLLGLIGGVALALNIDVVVPFIENLIGVKFLAKDVYYISELPSDVEFWDVAVIAVVSFALCLLATLYPSWRAARSNPAEALRYE
ncbi:MAG TPA: lipoprotein-releasing ABC transporter permease subunit [Burkholderiales bacterium]|nr:lipoprotein-releasing ABC transporter permease subunit [Burkholderiales bacterium]